MATTDQDQVFIDNAIRVNTIVNSNVSNTGEFQAQTILIYNDLNQNVTIQLQGSVDKTNWLDIGDAFSVTTLTKDYATVSDYFPYYRVTAKCAAAPTTGDLNAWILKAGAIT